MTFLAILKTVNRNVQEVHVILAAWHQKKKKKKKKRKRKKDKVNACKIQYTDAHRPAPSFPSQVITVLKGLKKHEDKEPRKTKHDAPRNIYHKAAQNENNTGTTALERAVA